MGNTYPGRLGLQQRVLPSYRAVFVDTLAEACHGGLSVFAGEPLANEGIDPIDKLQVAQLVKANNRYLSNPSSRIICLLAGRFDTLAGSMAARCTHRRGQSTLPDDTKSDPLDARERT